MHSINKFLHYFGLRLSRVQPKSDIPVEFEADYGRKLVELEKNPGGFDIFRELRYESRAHPFNYMDYECSFAASHIKRLNPENILDIGSYRHFILGILSHFQVTTIDVRDRTSISHNETIITCDAKNLKFPNEKFDVVMSLSSLEHFGLGRYGDQFDLNADKKAIDEMIRVLKPNGRLIFTTTITRAHPAIGFNAHRIYNQEMIKGFCADLICEEEKFYIRRTGDFCSFEEVTTETMDWDVYCGCWKKKMRSA
jgi:SAM-dependent methyltransferase